MRLNLLVNHAGPFVGFKDRLDVDKMKSKRKTLFLSFLVPLLLVTGYFIYRHFAPFGSSSVLTVDMDQQYVDFFAHFRTTLLHNPGGFLYSFSKALGGDMLGTWSYYLMSPFNLIVLLFPLAKLPSAIGVITILKYGFAGLTSGYFFVKSRKATGWTVIAFATSYALIGWMVANQLNTIWVDGVILLPLIFLGLTQLLQGGSSKCYIFSLAAMLIINYYIAWMIAIFVGAYTIIFTLCKAYPTKGSYLHGFLKWLGASLISGALSAWILIPTYYALLKSKPEFGHLKLRFKFEYNPLHMIGKFMNGAFDLSQLPTGTPNIFVGSLALLLCLYYFFAPTIKRRLKLANGLLLGFLILSMCFQPLDVLWHGLALPVWYPYRFSFVFSFLMIIMAFESLQEILKNGLSWKRLSLPIAIVALGFIYISLSLKKFFYLSPINLVVGLIFMLLVIGLLAAWSQPSFKKWFPFTLFVVVTLEMGANLAFSLNAISYFNAADYTQFSNILRKANKKIQDHNSSFYRVAAVFNRSRNDPFTGNYNGGSVFSSTLETATTQFYNNIGNPSGPYYAVYSNGTTFTDSFLSMKYYLAQRRVKNKQDAKISREYLATLTARPDLKNYPLTTHTNLINVYKNPNALPLGFLARSQYLFPINNMSETAAYQNQIATQLDPSVGALFSHAAATKVTYNNAYPIPDISNGQIRKRNLKEPASITLTVPIQKHYSYYMSVGPRMGEQNISYEVDGHPLQQYGVSAQETLENFATGTDHAKTVQLRLIANANKAPLQNVYLYKINNDRVAKLATNLKKNAYHVTKHTDRMITGKITSNQNNRTMVTTIPYGKGWHATVDGHKVTPQRWAKMFITLNINKGTHTVTFTYTPVGLKVGSLISGITLLGLIGYGGFTFYKKRRDSKNPAPSSQK